MRQYRFEDMKTGMTERFVVTVGAEQQEAFFALTGDSNPLHRDADFAKKRGFEDRVVYGMLASAYYSTLAGVYLPGENCLINECKVTYYQPVYPGDVLTVEGVVSDVRESTRRVKIAGKMTRADGTVVNTAVIAVSFTGERSMV
ncbi:MAG: dehydratase [Lachnospiraceae bacterium]|nr:dehydratase [Lachnospiraceae bacterium]